jgi:5-methylcytosine-specific restriction endonuclease McrA
MARSKSDISNSAIRIFLQKVGKFYDEARGYTAFGPTKLQKQELLDYFDNQCCFCGTKVTLKSLSQDHLIPMNKEYLGLHAWGNVVPCCKDFNSEKQQRDWKSFLQEKTCEKTRSKSQKRIQDFVKSKNYDPKLDLHDSAGNLYQDVGEVTMTLINLRFKQATTAIQDIVNKK